MAFTNQAASPEQSTLSVIRGVGSTPLGSGFDRCPISQVAREVFVEMAEPVLDDRSENRFEAKITPTFIVEVPFNRCKLDIIGLNIGNWVPEITSPAFLLW